MEDRKKLYYKLQSLGIKVVTSSTILEKEQVTIEELNTWVSNLSNIESELESIKNEIIKIFIKEESK